MSTDPAAVVAAGWSSGSWSDPVPCGQKS